MYLSNTRARGRAFLEHLEDAVGSGGRSTEFATENLVYYGIGHLGRIVEELGELLLHRLGHQGGVIRESLTCSEVNPRTEM